MFLRLLIFAFSLAFSETKITNDNFVKAERFYSEKKYSIAQDFFYKAIIDNPLDEKSYFYLANLQTLTSNYQEADKNYQKAIDLKSDDPDYLFNFASLKYLNKNYNESEALYQKALSIRSNFPEVYSRLAKQYFDTYEWEKSASALEKVLDLQPSHPDKKTISNLILKLRAGKAVAETKRVEFLQSMGSAPSNGGKGTDKGPSAPAFSLDVKEGGKIIELDTKSEGSIKQKGGETDIVE